MRSVLIEVPEWVARDFTARLTETDRIGHERKADARRELADRLRDALTKQDPLATLGAMLRARGFTADEVDELVAALRERLA